MKYKKKNDVDGKGKKNKNQLFNHVFFFSYEFNIFILEKQIKNNLKYKKHIKFKAYMLIVNQKQKSYLLIKNYKG